ncbi:MAG: DUF4340 domain-containing protein [Candidatus Omnitrophota bacterium]
MKLVRTFVFILLFAAVATIYFFQVRLAKQTLAIIPDEVNRTVAISKNDPIDRVELCDNVQKTKIKLRKVNGAWEIERPVHYPAENQVAEGFVVAARMASQQPRLRAEKEWGEYGLEKPELEILFGLPGKRAVTLLIGAQAPVGKAIFARWAEERGFFLLPPEMKAMFRQTVYGLRQKRLFRTPADRIQKISVEMGEYSCQWKKDGGTWYWLEPVQKLGQKVPAGRIDLVVGGLESLHVREFLDSNKKSKAELGFFMIHDLIQVEAEDGPPGKRDEARPSSQGGKKETFYFGNEVPEKNAYYGFREGEDVVFLVDRVNVVELFDFIRKIQAEDLKPETKDLSPKTGTVEPKV